MLAKRTWFLLLMALGLRLLLQGWDAGVVSSSLHPDERQVGFVTERLDGWFDDPEFYAYGSLHFQAVRATATILSMGESLRGLVVSGRIVSLLASMLAIVLGWILAHRAWGRRTGELFLLLIAWVPLDLQQSHFATVEAHHTAWIMLAIAGCYWLAVSGKQTAAAAAGAAVGASLAVKVASLALSLPLMLAILIAIRGRDLIHGVRLASLAAGAAISMFWLCQPWAFAGGRPPWVLILAIAATAVLVDIGTRRSHRSRTVLLLAAAACGVFALLQAAALTGIGSGASFGRLVASSLIGGGLNPAYLAGVGEQVRMVMGEADLPYVRVFVNTLPVLYPLRELALWGWGPLLVLVGMAAAASGMRITVLRWWRWMRGEWNRSAILLLIVLSWLLPMTVRLSTLYVKYLRYWEPLVVPVTLVVAWWLARLPQSYRRRATLTVAAGTVLWGLSFTWGFVDPHPHGTATRWMQPMLEADQVVAFESWDETIALNPDEGTVDVFSLPSYDLPDDEAKVMRWCADLDRADWVVMTSNRIQRTIFSNPERFEKTGRLYRLLLSGEAGFELMTRARRSPRLFGLRWPVQRADESFVNYDFPEVLIFRRTSRIAPDRLVERVNRPLPHLGELGYQEIAEQFIESHPAIPPMPSGGRQLVDLIVWLLTFSGLTLAAWALLLPIIGRWPDAGTGLAAVTGWIAPSWLMWFGNELGLWPAGPVTASWVFVAVLAVGALVLSTRWREAVAVFAQRRGGITKVVVVALSIGLLFLIVRAFNPAIYWGEKPMDFSFLNAFLRADQWPTGEPWMAGMPLHYYYFGEVLAAFPILVAGCSAGVGYNLMAATIPALGAAALAGLGLMLARRRRWWAAVVLPTLVLLTGNLAWPWLLEHARSGKWFDMWWATSRVIPGFAIDEYPLWTALFADLHGHFIALPIMIAALLWGWLSVQARDNRWIVSAAMCGLCAAVLVATNPWDLFVLCGTLACGTLVSARRRTIGLARLAAAGALSLLAAAPFVVELLAGINAGAGERGLFLTKAEFAPAWAVLRHFGLFVIPLVVAAVLALGKRSWMALPAAGLGVIAGLAFDSSAAALALALTGLFGTTIVVTRDHLARLGWSLATFATLAVAASERFTLIDRMNTLFKVYNGVWLLLAVALAAVLLRTRGGKRTVIVATWVPLQIIAMANLPLGVAQGVLQPRTISPRPTLDGQAFLRTRDRDTWFLVRVLQGTARPGAAVAESAGPYYSQHTRITMHTGQPTVVGWDWHLKQRGQDPIEIAARFADLEMLYSGRDGAARREVLDRYRVGWIVLGDLERKQYGIRAGESLAPISGVVKIAERAGAEVYRVLPKPVGITPTIKPVLEIPTQARLVGEIPRLERPTFTSLTRTDSGALVVLSNGGIVALDLEARVSSTYPSPDCGALSAAAYGDRIWAVCEDGSVLSLDGERWSRSIQLSGATGLTAADRLWAFGPRGLWQLDRGNWRQASTDGVSAAAANGPWLASSDGSTVRVGRNSANPQMVGGSLDGITAIAWQGSNLWALAASGLYRSGGAILPWRRVLDDTGAALELGGGSDSMWMVRSDGLILEWPPAECPSPWSANGSPSSAAGLKEPRGLAVSSDGWFAVADTQNHRIRWFSENGICLDAYGIEGDGDEGFREPSGLALADDGRLAIADTWNGRVKILDPSGTTTTLGGALFGPRSVLWTQDGSLLVSDTGNRRVHRFSPPSWGQALLAELPGPVVGLAQVAALVAVAVPVEGAVFLIDGGDGQVVRRLEVPGWSGRTQQEGYLALLPSGRLAASAPQTAELWSLDPSGAEPPELLQGDLPGITAITLLPDGDLLASLTWEHRLVRIELEP